MPFIDIADQEEQSRATMGGEIFNKNIASDDLTRVNSFDLNRTKEFLIHRQSLKL